MSPSAYVIAEAGVNHDGSEARALELIDIAAAAGADAVKFQMFNPDLLVTAQARTAGYQAKNLGNSVISQRDMLRKLTFANPETYIRLHARCIEKHIDFLCTPFDSESLAFLTSRTRMRYLKLGSGEVAHGPLLLAAARTGLPIILSTGMSDLREIGEALTILHFGYTQATGYPRPAQPSASELAALQGRVTLLHCVSQYPAPPEASNLKTIDTLREAFGLPVGFSDHSAGYGISLAAIVRGAGVIEKHFTYDVKAAGPDHAASLSPQGLKDMVTAIRQGRTVEAQPAWLGDGRKICQPIEMDTRQVAWRSVVARVAIPKGKVFSEDNLICKRPAGGGVPPNSLWSLLGKTAKDGYVADSFIHPDELD